MCTRPFLPLQKKKGAWVYTRLNLHCPHTVVPTSIRHTVFQSGIYTRNNNNMTSTVYTQCSTCTYMHTLTYNSITQHIISHELSRSEYRIGCTHLRGRTSWGDQVALWPTLYCCNRTGGVGGSQLISHSSHMSGRGSGYLRCHGCNLSGCEYTWNKSTNSNNHTRICIAERTYITCVAKKYTTCVSIIYSVVVNLISQGYVA